MGSAQAVLNCIARADEDTLIALSNKGTYKRACKDAEGVTPDYIEDGGVITLGFSGETVKIAAPLENSVCSCPSRSVCRHIVGALVALKRTLPESVTAAAEETPTAAVKSDKPEKKEPPQENAEQPQGKTLSVKDALKVKDCTALCRELLCEILSEGLVRTPADMSARLEAAAVRCHSAKAADAEHRIRDIGSRLTEHSQRRVVFNGSIFAEKLCRCSSYLTELGSTDPLTQKDLGDFRKKYTALDREITLLPLGARSVYGGEYQGEIFYFLDLYKSSGRQFLTLSDLRPTYYGKSFKRGAKVVPWDLAVPLRNVIKSCFRLKNAKVSGEKLSSSGETKVVSQTDAYLDIPAVRRLITDDFSRLALQLDRGSYEYETDRLFLIRPHKCVRQTFDNFDQQYIMEIEDKNGCRIKVKAKYRAESKEFIEQLEKIGERMLKEPNPCFTLLVLAQITDGELTVFPIEIYDFISPPEKGTEGNSPSLRCDISQDDADCAEQIMELFSRLRRTLYYIVHCGLRSEISDDDKLVKCAEDYGMTGLADLAAALFESASAYRHDLDRSAEEVMERMVKLYDYIETGEKKLQTISALAKMRQC